jgi:hypothetical protein
MKFFCLTEMRIPLLFIEQTKVDVFFKAGDASFFFPKLETLDFNFLKFFVHLSLQHLIRCTVISKFNLSVHYKNNILLIYHRILLT